jgi:hypothetical protein
MPLARPHSHADAEHARLRVWAAEVRDAGGTHAPDAALLCRLLDLHRWMSERAARPDSAANLADGLLTCVAAVVERLKAAGLAPSP